jgi:hypothetical protein
MFNRLLNRITPSARKQGLTSVLCAGSKFAAKYLVLVLFASLAVGGWAQSTNSGDIRGTVTDTTGALIPGVTVSVLDVDTGVLKVFISNQDGLFETSSIMSGHYTLTFKKLGFEQYVRGPISLEVGVTTVNAILKAGSTTESVTVTADVPLLDTEAGDQTETLQSNDMAQLPQVGADWENFMIVLPGTAGAAEGRQGASNPGQLAAANGNLPYNNILEDAASITLPGSQNANPAIFDVVSELRVSDSSFSAQYGGAGLIINQLTKSGTDHFHGSAYDYLQNDAFNAAQYGFGYAPPVPRLRYNDYGGSIGGPLLKKKMFFFFDYDRIVDHGAAGNNTSTIPTAGVMGGDFSGQKTIYDPTTQTIAYDAGGNPYPVRNSFLSEYGSNEVPSALIDTVASKIQQYFPTQSNHLAGGRFVAGTLNSVGVLTNNFYSSIPNSAPYRKYFGRLDYDVTPSSRITISVQDSDTPRNTLNPITECPVGCQTSDGEDWNSQISDVWNISPRLINEARMGFTNEVNKFIDGSTGKGYPAKLGWTFAKGDVFPNIYLSSYSSLTTGTSAVGSENVYDPSDVITMIRGKHVLHFGGEFLAYQNNGSAWGNLESGSMGFGGAYTENWTVDPSTGLARPDSTTGVDYADFLLGYAASWSALYSPEYGDRYKTPQMFVQDDYKIRPNLTVNIGMRYQINHGYNATRGNEASFDPTVLNPATNTLGAMWYGTTKANGRSQDLANTYKTFLPRFGLSWSVRPDTVVRGGFGLYSSIWSMTYSSAQGNLFQSSGNVSDQTNGTLPLTRLDGPGTDLQTGTALPYLSQSTDPAHFNGQAVSDDKYHTPVPEVSQWNVSIEHQFRANYGAQVAYVASHGYNLSFPVDINQVPLSKLSPNDSADRPYPQYQGIYGNTYNAISNYNSLQVSITKRMSSGLSFNFNYVWSHFLDDQDSSGWGGRGGPQTYQNSYNPHANYSNSNFDVRNALKGYAVYELPFGHGRLFLNGNKLLDEVVGGWQVSGTLLLQSGNPFTVYSTQNTYALAGNAFPNWSGVSSKPHNRSNREWYNPAAFVLPANGTFGDVRRNSLCGPGIREVNLSGGKTFSVPWEGIKLQIRADATNAFNHPSFGAPNETLSGASAVGQPFTNLSNITWTTVGGRTMQLTAHVTF